MNSKIKKLKKNHCKEDLSIFIIAAIIIETNSVVRVKAMDRQQGVKYFLVLILTYKEVLTRTSSSLNNLVRRPTWLN